MKFALGLMLAAVAAFAQAGPPAGYQTVSISGMATTIPTLQTALQNWVNTTENVSILSLVNEGFVNPKAVADGVLAQAQVFCAEAQGQPKGCDDPKAASAPFQAQVLMVFGLVPASQWDPTKFSANMPVYAAAYIQIPAPGTPPPAPKPIVGVCYAVTGNVGTAPVQMCYGAPGVVATNYSNGQVIIDPVSGKEYIAVVTTGLFGPSIWFSPLGN